MDACAPGCSFQGDAETLPAWQSLNAGLPGTDRLVRAVLAHDDGQVFAGGNFTSIGGVPAARVASWDGARWSSLGEGVDGGVGSLATQGSLLLAGGNFSRAGGQPARCLATWDGAGWSSPGFGTGATGFGSIFDILPMGGELLVGGVFRQADGFPADHLAAWNGSDWRPVDGALDERIYAMTATDNGFFIAGEFTSVGEQPAAHIAENREGSWETPGPVPESTLPLADLQAVRSSDGEFPPQLLEPVDSTVG